MERLFVNTNFKYVDVITVPNGESWTVDRLAKQIASLYRTKDINADKVFVWFDRERRQETCDAITAAVKAELMAAGVGANSLIICIPDRMTENVILADEELIREEFDFPEYTYAGDGSNGKAILKGLYEGRKGAGYKETFHGAMLLKKTHLSRSSAKSGSAALFMASFDLDCWWRR